MFKNFISGPKGVINDWRKFKLESEDGDSMPPSKKEILRQMSSPQSRDDKDSKDRISRKVRGAKTCNQLVISYVFPSLRPSRESLWNTVKCFPCSTE